MDKTIKFNFIADMSSFAKALDNIKASINKFQQSVSGIKPKTDFNRMFKGVSTSLKTANVESKKFSRAITDTDLSIRRISSNRIDLGLKKSISDSEKLKKNIKGIKNTQEKGVGLGDVIGLAVAVQGVKRIASLGQETLRTKASMEATSNTLTTIFGSAVRDITKYINEFSGALGMSEKEGAEFALGYGVMLKDIGTDIKDTTKLTQALMTATSVLARNTDYDMETVADSIKSGLTGNTMAMDKLGIELKEGALTMTDAFKRLSGGKSFRQLDYETQSLIRTMAIIEKTTKIYGHTLDNNLKASLNTTSAAMKDFKNNMFSAIGEALEPAARAFANVSLFLKEISKRFSQMNEGSRKAISVFLITLAVIPLLILGYVALSLTLTFLKGKIQAVTASSAIMNAVLSKGFLMSAGVILFGITALAVAFGGFQNVINNIGQAIQATFIYMAGSIIYTVGKIIGIFTGGQNALISFGQKMMNSASNTARSIRNSSSKIKSGADTQKKAIDSSTGANLDNAKSADKASKANKKLADNLQAFDEINKLQLDTPESGGGVPGIGGGAGSFNIGDLPQYDMKGIGDLGKRFDELKDKVKGVLPYLTMFGLLIAGFKLGGFALKIADIASKFKGLSTGVGTATTSTGLLGKAAAALGKPLGTAGAAATAVGLAIAAVWAGVLVYFEITSGKITEQTKAINDHVKANLESYKASQKRFTAAAEGQVIELKHTDRLYSELRKITDVNGKIKKGYEGRAKYIAGELTRATGHEITLEDNKVKAYDKTIEKIRELIEEKKRETLISLYGEREKELMKEKQQAIKDQIIQENEINRLLKEKDEKGGIYAIRAQKRIEDLEKQKEENFLKIKSIDGELLDIDNFNTAVMIGNKDAIIRAEDELTSSVYVNGQKIKLSYKDRYQKIIEEENMARDHHLKTYGDLETFDQEYYKKKKEELAVSLREQSKTIENLTPDIIENWKTLATTSQDEYKKQIELVPAETRKNIQASIDAVDIKKQTYTNKFEEVGKYGAKALESTNPEYRKEGIEMLTELIKGMDDSERKRFLKTTVGNRADEIDKELKKMGTLSESSGKEVLKGIQKGVENGTLKSGLFTSMSSLADNVLGRFKNRLGIQSPSKKFIEQGKYMLQGLQQGIKKNSNIAVNETENVAKKLSEIDFNASYAKALKTSDISQSLQQNKAFIEMTTERSYENKITGKVAIDIFEGGIKTGRRLIDLMEEAEVAYGLT